MMAAGAMSKLDLDLGSESGVVVTDPELENIAPVADVSGHTFSLKQVRSSYPFNFMAKLDCGT